MLDRSWGPQAGNQKPFLGLILHEYSEAADRQSPRQAIGYRVEHAVDIRLRAQLTSEFNQREAVIIPVTVEQVPIEDFLNPVPDRLKHERRNQNQRDHFTWAEVLNLAQHEEHAVENPEHRECRQSVYVPLLENDVHVHQ